MLQLVAFPRVFLYSYLYYDGAARPREQRPPFEMSSTKTTSPLKELLKSQPNVVKFLKYGDLVEGTLLQKGIRGVFFDLGPLGTGILRGSELQNAREALKAIESGASVTAKVIEPEDDDGYVVLSLAEAGRQKAWASLQELSERGEVVPAPVVGANSGGLLVQLGELQGFLPVSQLTSEHYPRVDDGDRSKILEELKKFIGQELKIKLINVNPRTRKLIVSEKETVAENLKELLERYKAGDTVDGVISGVADFGAFMKFTDNTAIEGLIHISELDHRLIENPKEVVALGDGVKAKIIEIKDGRVSLSLKALKTNPWETIGDQYKEGDTVEGAVARFNPYGAFIVLNPNIHGLIHVSEFGSVEEMKKQLAVGASYTFIISMMRPQEKRIILKLKK